MPDWTYWNERLPDRHHMYQDVGVLPKIENKKKIQQSLTQVDVHSHVSSVSRQ